MGRSKCTGVHLELITDNDKYLMIEKGIREASLSYRRSTPKRTIHM